MSLALSGDTIAYLMSLGLDQEQMKGLIDRLNRDALAVAPPTALNGQNEERERLRNGSTYAERKRAKDRARQARLRDEARQSRDPTATSRDIDGESPATLGDTRGEPATPLTGAQVVTPSLPSLRSEEVKTPTEPIGSASPKVAKPKKSRTRMCPADWSPSAGDLAVGAEEGFSPGEIERELAKFRDHEFRDPHSEWSPTFRKWLRNATDRRPRKAHERPHHDARFEARQANLARALAGADSAAGRHWKP